MDDTKLDDENSRKVTQTGLEEMLEDFFGLNVRSFRTLSATFRKPKEYFAAARTANWSNELYTPSPRLWLGLMAITIATRFLWGAEDSAMVAATADVMNEAFSTAGSDADLPPIDWTQEIGRFFDIVLFIQPIMLIVTLLLFASFVRFWGERLTYVVRVRYIFAIIIPATAINVVLTISMIFAPEVTIPAISFGSIAIMLIVYGVTAYRGPFAAERSDSRIPKSIVLAIILFFAVMLSNIASQIVGVVIIVSDAVTSANIRPAV